MERELIKFADNANLRGIANTTVDSLKVQKNLDRSEYWASNKMQFSNEKSLVLHLGKNKQMHGYRIDAYRSNYSRIFRQGISL